jgi:hypothetical protein
MYVQLKEESASPVNVDKEFAMFREAEKQATERLFQQAKRLKIFAAIVGIAVCILVVVWGVLFMKTQSRLRKQRGDVQQETVKTVSHNLWRFPHPTKVGC